MRKKEPPVRASTRRRVAIACAALTGAMFALAQTSCVHVYQPLSGLQQPAVIDPRLPNFRDVRLTVRCLPGDLITPQEAGILCQRVGVLFENQGALVATTTEAYAAPEEEDFESIDETELPSDDEDAEGGTSEEGAIIGAGGAEKAEGPQRMALSLELTARELHQANNLLSWVICIGTFTVVPSVTESTFAQDVAIRDSTGSLLVSESLEGRIVTRFGAGSWLGNKLVDIAVRNKDDQITGDAAEEDLSADLYQQLSQLLFDAKMSARVLGQIPSSRGGRP